MKGLLAGLVLLLFASTAMAQIKDTKWYIGGGGGPSSLQGVCDGFAAAGGYESCDDESNAWKAILGMKVYKYTFLELQYTDAGHADVVAPGSTGTIEINPRMASLFLKFEVPIAVQDRLGLFAKFGANYFDTTYDGTGVYAGAEGDDGLDTAIGAGISWRGWDHFSVQAEWENFNDATTINDGDINMGTISVLFHF